MRELSIITTHEVLYMDDGAYVLVKIFGTWENGPTVQVGQELRWVPLSTPYNFEGKYNRD